MALLATIVMLAGCTAEEPTEPGGSTPALGPRGCGPLTPATVAGPPPPYVGKRTDRFRGDHAACAGVWLRSMRTGFVPQGVAVAGRTAWVSGYDGDQREGELWCTVSRVDLATGRATAMTVLHEVPVNGVVRSCRHAGGLARDRHGIWLTQASALWLLDAETLAVRRMWDLLDGVRGSFAVVDDAGRLGIGAFRTHRRGWLDWLDPAALVAGSATVIERADVSEHVVAPTHSQGAIWGRLGGSAPALWFARSHTRCGILVGPAGRRALVPGAEGMALDGRDRLWVVSESGARPYQRAGGRPVIPSLVRYDDPRVDAWPRPGCTV